MTALSVILIGWNVWKDLQPCLQSLLDACSGISYEIIYVDNGSKDGTLSHVRRQFPQVNLVENRKNLGVSKARNQGIRIAKGKYIWILDSDTVVNSAAIQEMLLYMDKHANVGICACRQEDKDGNVQNSYRPFPSISQKMKSALHHIFLKFNISVYGNLTNPYKIINEQPVEVDYVIGACQMIRKELFETIGLLDEKIFYGPEDADFCLRAKRAGWKTVYLPCIHIIHHYKRITTRKIFDKLTLYHIQALCYYFKKHKHDLSGK